MLPDDQSQICSGSLCFDITQGMWAERSSGAAGAGEIFLQWI